MTVRQTAALVGFAAAFVTGVGLIRWIRPGLLADSSPDWTAQRLLLGLAAACGAAAAGAGAAIGFAAWARSRPAAEPLEPIPLRKRTRTALALAAIAAGATLRFIELSRWPSALWVDDLSLVAPALELAGSPSDFADATRATPYGVSRPYGSVGVLYLEGYRAALRLCGTTVFGVRLPSALAGAASIATAALLGRALLPGGGGMLTALILAGLRWHLILSRWAWNMIALAPVVDLATLALISARRRRSVGMALAAGSLAGLGAHVYLSAWPAGAALALFALWPATPAEEPRSRLARSAAFVVGFAACAAPLFLLREGRSTPYFARAADHNVFLEMRRTLSFLPPAAAAADAFASPWFLADPSARNDLPGRSRLGFLLGVPVAIALARAARLPREPLSGLLLSHAAAFLAAVVAGGQADNPNGSRFAYLATLTAVAAAAGALWLIARVPLRLRHSAAVAAVGAVVIHGALSARDALLVWSQRPETFRAFHGQDTLIGRAAARWSAFGEVEIASGLGHSPLAIEAVRRYRLDPDISSAEWKATPARLRVRLAKPGTRPEDGERAVERIEDPDGRLWAVVLARRAGT